MFCCDFIETTYKYNLVCPFPILKEMMKERELIIAYSIRKNLIFQCKTVPDDIEAICQGKEIDEPKNNFLYEISVRNSMIKKTKPAS